MKRINVDVIERIKEMLKTGSTSWMIQEETGVSAGTIQKCRNELKKEGYIVGYDIWPK